MCTLKKHLSGRSPRPHRRDSQPALSVPMRLERPDGVAPPQLGIKLGGDALPAPPRLLEEARHALADAVVRLQHTCGFTKE